MDIRKPVVAGSFYFNDNNQIKNFVLNNKLNTVANAKAIISPHAGWVYSGKTAVKTMCQLKPFKNIILLGVNHRGIGAGIGLFSSQGKWSFPNGEILINEEIDQFIFENSNGTIPFDNNTHNFEHSIEVQIPLLIELFGTNFNIIPISIWDYSQAALEFLGSLIIRTLERFPNTAILASSDFTHYENADFAKEQDNLAIRKILINDYEGFYKVVNEHNISLCGLGPIYVLLKIADYFHWNSSIVEHTNSGEVTGNFNEVVSYCGIKFV